MKNDARSATQRSSSTETQRIVAKEVTERTGFEPAVGGEAYTGLANRRFRPLSHLSKVGRQNVLGAVQGLAKNTADWLSID